MKRLNIIGCGSVGKTLGYLFAKKDVFEICDVMNRSVDSSSAAVEFLQAGRAITSLDEMRPADVFLISTSDAHIVDCCDKLAATGLLEEGKIVFQCSGAIPSTDWIAARKTGARVGSVHPVNSFAHPESFIATFDGTFCAVEGDSEALDVLCAAFEAIGAHTFKIYPEQKTLYHAANVIVCNYLTALIEFASQTYIKSGLKHATALRVMEPVVRGTVDNIFKFDTTKALTGPIARGDSEVVTKQLEALTEWNPKFGELYRKLGEIALELSRKQGNASKESLSALTDLLSKYSKE